MFTILIMAFGKAIGTDVLSLAAVFSQKIVFGLTARSDIFGLSLFEEPYLWIQQTYCNTLKMLWTPKITFGKFFNKYWPKKKKKIIQFRSRFKYIGYFRLVRVEIPISLDLKNIKTHHFGYVVEFQNEFWGSF